MLQYFKNMKFQKKIWVLCLLVSFVPVLLLGSFCYHQVKLLLTSREKTALSESLDQESRNLSSKISDYENAMQYITWNNNLIQALNHDYDNNADMYLAYRDTIDPLLFTIKSIYTDISNITIYTDITIHPHGSSLRSLEEIQEYEWYERLHNSSWPVWITSMEDQMLSLVCKITDVPQNTVSVIKMDIDYAKVFSSMDTLYAQSYGILLVDRDNTPIYRFDTFPEHSRENTLLPEQLADPSSSCQDDYVIASVTNICDGWNLYLYRPIQIILEPTQTILPYILLIIILCLISIILASFFLSHVVVHPLENLTSNMDLVEQEHFSVSVDYDSTDEIGHLIKSFQNMVNRLNHLVNEVLNGKILQQKYEMQALQAQINPHFLYNSLSLINSKAILNDQKEISEMAQYLSSFYRTSLNKGESVTTVKEELENMQNYVNIQLIMHSHSFDTFYDVKEDILCFTMQNLLLQPLVENAILHGIDYVEKPNRGILTILGYQTADTLVFRISDNGPGIAPEKLTTILTTDSGGYGVQNVHKRIQLFYGAKYGLHYESEEGKGTTVTLTIPKQSTNQTDEIMH